jgi:hypothetical protein
MTKRDWQMFFWGGVAGIILTICLLAALSALIGGPGQ